MPRKAKAKAKAETPAADAATPAAEIWTCVECGYEHEGEEAGVAECQACGEQRPTAGAAADTEPDRFDGYVVGAVLSVEELSGKLKACSVDVGAAELTVVTNANVSEGARIVVAKARQDCRCAPTRHRLSLACAWQVGAAVGDERVSKRSMGGRVSEGMLCDAPMLGWQGGGAGAAALVPPAFAPGDRPPERRPRMDGFK